MYVYTYIVCVCVCACICVCVSPTPCYSYYMVTVHQKVTFVVVTPLDLKQRILPPSYQDMPLCLDKLHYD